MHIVTTTLCILRQLTELCSQMEARDYSRALPMLLENSIGKHMRHILEFYDRLKLGMQKGIVNYDQRKHNAELEMNLELAKEKLTELQGWVNSIEGNCDLEMQVSYDLKKDSQLAIETNLSRELVYNIEHAIHHMAIIRIALQNEFPHVKVDKDFGIAFSTIRYRDNKASL